jgi:uncharacterized protein
MNRVQSIAGHLWTVLPSLADRLRPRLFPGARPIETRIADPAIGEVTIRAQYHEVPSADTLVVIVHGIVGNADSGYCIGAAQAAVEAGCSAVRISMRGADGDGDDIYHAGLTDDLKALLSMKCLRGYRRVFLLGYSLGGNIVLRAASDHIDARIEGVVAICPPLDFKTASENLDRPTRRFYRDTLSRHALLGYAVLENRGRAQTSTAKLSRARSSEAWNQMTIVPRFGFRDVDHYYEATSMHGRWHRIRVPVLIVSSRYDPMVPYDSVRRMLANVPSNVQAECCDAGGHVYFPSNIDLGEDAASGVEPQCIAWIARHARRAASIAVGA